MPSQSHSILQQFIKWKSFEYPFLWLSAAGISATMIWLPLINAMMCILFFLLWGYYRKFRIRNENRVQLILFTNVYLITAISIFYSENTSEALRILQLKLPLLLFPIVFASGIDWGKEPIRLLQLIFSWSVSLFCIITISHAVLLAVSEGNVQTIFGYNILPLKFMYASVASLYCVFSAVIQLSEMTEKRKFLIQHMFPLVLNWATLILLSNRMGLFLCVIITLFFVFRLMSTVIAKWATGTMLLLILVSLYIWNQTFQKKVKAMVQFNSQQMIQLDQDASLGRTWDGLQIRLAIWNCAAGIIKENFWKGVGVGDTQQTLQRTYDERKFYFASRYNSYNAHNQFVEQWLMTGVVGCFLLLLSVGLPLVHSFKSGRETYLIFITIFIFFCFTESMLEVSKGVVWFSFFNSIFAFQKNER
jgi:O-antigen ligase